MTRKVVRLSGSLTVATARPPLSVTTAPRKNAVVWKRERRMPSTSMPPPPPGARWPFSPSTICAGPAGIIGRGGRGAATSRDEDRDVHVGGVAFGDRELQRRRA